MRLQQRQDSVIQESQRQTRLLLDTLRQSFEIQRELRGETSFRFGAVLDSMRLLNAKLDQIELAFNSILDRLENPRVPVLAPGGAGQGVPSSMVQDLYEQGMMLKAQMSYATARMAFTQIVAEHPSDPLAVEAQIQIAEIYAAEKKPTDAIAEFEKVPVNWPQNRDASARALLRAGVVAQEDAKDIPKARQLYRRVQDEYADQAASSEAARRLSQIG
jgi:TolA-binding protein